MMNRILCSTGALIGRPNGRDYTLLNECAKRLDCDGFEFMMYDDWYDKADEIATFLRDFPKPFPVFHVEKNVGDLISRNESGDTEKALELFEINCVLAQKIGAEKLVLHLWSGLDSDKDFPHNIEVYKYVREIAERYRLMLTIENVVCNNSDPMTHLADLAEIYPDISFTFDTKMAEFHGQLSELYDEKNRYIWVRVAHMHINDYKGGYKDWSSLKTLHIGDGQIDFERFFGFVKCMGYTGDLTIESTSFDNTGVIDFERMNQSIRIIREY
ncbi:MAG: sugar phosphate isomerase/epimerase [Ruminococcus sp.]|nr:sugar phosphate isomerase/epimerase [Ruminococcus sp.]